MVARVLLVHGDAFMQRTLAGALRSEDLEVEVVGSGEEALTRCAAAAPTLVLTGALLPGIDGCGLVERLHADPATAAVPCMLLTSLQDLDDLSRAFALGFDDIVSRPCEPAELRARVRTVLGRSGGPRDLQVGQVLRGTLPARGLPPLLRLLAAQRRSGKVELECDDPPARCQLRLRDGKLVAARVELGPPLREAEVVLFALGWRAGSFSFTADSAAAPVPQVAGSSKR